MDSVSGTVIMSGPGHGVQLWLKNTVGFLDQVTNTGPSSSAGT